MDPLTMGRDKLREDYIEIIGDSPQMFKVLQQIESLGIVYISLSKSLGDQ